MKRYYMSPIKQYDDPDIGPYYAHHFQVAYPGIEFEGGEIAPDPQTGVPLRKASLVLVAGIDHRAYDADPDLVALPAVDLDLKVSSIKSATKVAAKEKLKSSCGYTDAEIDEAWNNADGMRDVLNFYGRENNPNFDCNNFDLTDL